MDNFVLTFFAILILTPFVILVVNTYKRLDIDNRSLNYKLRYFSILGLFFYAYTYFIFFLGIALELFNNEIIQYSATMFLGVSWGMAIYSSFFILLIIGITIITHIYSFAKNLIFNSKNK